MSKIVCPRCGSSSTNHNDNYFNCHICGFEGENIENDPPVFLPPIDVSTEVFALAPSLWHLPTEVWEKIWNYVTGKGIIVAVLDTGYTKHIDGPTPVAQESFVNQPVVDRHRHGHGTHCIGTVLGRNGIGGAPEAELIVGKVLSDSGSGSSSGIAAGIKWAREQGAHIISMSLGGPSSYAPTNAQLDQCWTEGCWPVVAAGNDGYNGRDTIGWPGKHPSSICTAAYRRDGNIANFSSGGSRIDWACPGQDIISFSNTGNGYRSMSGTSMATPNGAAFLALIYEIILREGHPIWTTPSQLRTFFKNNMKDVGLPGFDVRFGWGIPLMQEILPQLISGFKWV